MFQKSKDPLSLQREGEDGRRGGVRGTKEEEQKEMEERGRKGQRREGGRKEEEREKEDGRKC